MARAQGKFFHPVSQTKSAPNPFSTFQSYHSTSLSTYHQQAHSFSCNALSLIPSLSAKYPQSNLKGKKTNQTCLPARLFDPQSPTTPLPRGNSPRLCLSPYIYLSIHPPHPSPFRITRYSSLANQQQPTYSLLPTHHPFNALLPSR